jgi:L-malate glycosyltransferase
MRIAFVYDAVYPWVKGGVEQRIYELSKRLISRGHEVHWFGLKWWDGENSIEYDGIILHGVYPRMAFYIKGRRSMREAFNFASGVLFSIRDDFDVIDCQAFPYLSSFPTKIISMTKQKPLVITWHEVWNQYWSEYLGSMGFLGWGIERATLNLTKKNVSVSERTRKHMKQMGAKNEIVVIPNGINFNNIISTKPYDEGAADIVFAGRLVKNKNVDVLVRAVDLIKEHDPGISCTIIGDGPERRSLEKLTTELDLNRNIVYTGFLEDHEGVIARMKSARVFAMPSTREGFGIAALEANACGLPVVAINHDRNAVCDMITEKNGFISDITAGSFAENISYALKTSEGLRKNCIESARKYDWEIIANMTESYYEDNIN